MEEDSNILENGQNLEVGIPNNTLAMLDDDDSVLSPEDKCSKMSLEDDPNKKNPALEYLKGAEE